MTLFLLVSSKVETRLKSCFWRGFTPSNPDQLSKLDRNTPSRVAGEKMIFSPTIRVYLLTMSRVARPLRYRRMPLDIHLLSAGYATSLLNARRQHSSANAGYVAFLLFYFLNEFFKKLLSFCQLS